MAATTTVFSDLLKRLTTDFPALTFQPGATFHWSTRDSTVYYADLNTIHAPLLLHEASHGILGHDGYQYDLDLIKLERAAWNKALELGQTYGVRIGEATIEDALDTYRDWLHERSRCPNCGQNGIQNKAATYECLICRQEWRVNDAKNCGLKRIKL